ncbi:Ig-like domain-containing protein [Cesiribacter sp. SM1]|uniref:Ig-like domain-containing protein n=1 Tax=Cesiribacter sp. SM1 TaxID=2861196 RepID=UPI001CD1A3C4|nr:Ig-like domain-containing protein [Cesiribacter sp. SM1]
MINFYQCTSYHAWSKRLALLLLLAFYAAVPLSAQTLVWEENFDGSTISPETWTFDFGDGCERGICGWGNQELQYYTSRPENARIEGGSLVIEALRENFQGKPFTSARLKTVGRVHFKYGTLEARIKVPDLENGLWPAFWMLGTTGAWPASGEIDIMEMGNAAAIANNVTNRRVGAATHWENNGSHASYGTHYDNPADMNDGYHLYKMTWDSEYIRVFVDDHEFYAIDIRGASAADLEEFHQQHYILLNLAVGGTYTGIMDAAGITAPMPAKMYVDYIKLYQNPGDELYLGKENALAGNYGIYSESPVLNDQLTYGEDAELYIWNNLNAIAGAEPFEGNEVLALRANGGNWFGLGVSNQIKNLQNFADGHLNFQFKTTYTGQFKVGVASGHGESWVDFPAGVEAYGLQRDGQWHQVSIPLSAFNNPGMGMHIDLGSMNQLFMFAGDAPAATTDFYFDNIYYSGGVAANPAPVVSIDSPANDAAFNTGDNIMINATASDPNGTVSKVDFYNGNVLLGTADASPYSFTWSNAPAGVHTLLAKATDNEGGVGTSSQVRVFVAAANNQAPTVSISAPEEGASYIKPATIAITADAADADGSVYKVEFYNGTTLLSTDYTSPYSYNWAVSTPGEYTITAKVYDNGNLSSTSEAVAITVLDNSIVADAYGIFTDRPEVTQKLTLGGDANLYIWNNMAPVAGASPYEGSNVLAFTVGAAWWGMGIAHDTRNLQHFASGTLKFHIKTTATTNFKVGMVTAAGESWVNFVPGQNQWGLVRDGQWHEVTIPLAAFTNKDLSSTSQVFMFSGDAPAAATDFYLDNIYLSSEAAGNTPPTVSISAPANNAGFTAPASITIAANATDVEGVVSKVDFYKDNELLGTDTEAPFSFSWNDVAAGTYTLTAKATDAGGLEATAAPVSITVEEPTATGPNLALNKPVTVSSVENPGTPGSAAVDGDLGTRWSSEFSDPQWLAVDLGATYNISQVKISWEPAYATHYELQVSEDGNSWTTVKTISGNTELENDHRQLAATGRHVRIYGTQRAIPYGYSIFELEVYGSEPDAYCGTAQNGDYSYSIVTDGENVNFTFHPLGEVAGGSLVILHTRQGAIGGYDGMLMTKNSEGDFTLSRPFPAGTELSIYFTYQVGEGGGERNSFAHPHSYTVGTSCGDGGGGNTAPTVSLTAPAAGAVYTAPAAITLTAEAADAEGAISRVEFYEGSTLLATVTSSPYSFVWENVAADAYTFTAKAYDAEGLSTSSTEVSVTVEDSSSGPGGICGTAANGDFAFSANTANGMVNITFHPLAPIAGSNFVLLYVKPSSQAGDYPGYVMNASGTDFVYSIPAPADGTELSLYFTYRISENGPERNSRDTPGTYVAGTVCGESENAAPAVSITSPLANASFDAPATILVEASAEDSDGSISKVEFYKGGELLETVESSPYSFSWSNVDDGTYSLTAIAYDNEGLTTTSEAVEISVVCASIFYADADGDGWGDASLTVTACEAPADYVSRAGDCNDTDASVNPDAADLCDGIDRNCDGSLRQPMEAPLVTVSPSSAVYTGGDANTIYLGYGPNSVTLAASNTTAATYTWTLAGETLSTKRSMVFKPAAAGTYTFTVTAKNADDCTASASETIRVVDVRSGNKGQLIMLCHKGQTVPIDKKSVQDHLAHGDALGSCSDAGSANARVTGLAETALAVYPNPAGGEAHIKLQLAQGAEYRLAIHDVRGVLVKTIASGTALQEGEHTYAFSAAGLAKGVYIIRLATETEVTTVRLVIQH